MSTKRALRSSILLLNSLSNFSMSGFSIAFALRSLMALVNSFLSITTPSRDGPALSEASFTSPALSPNMARSSFSSGEGSDSPFGVIFPIIMSPGLIWAPILIIPFSSRSFVASSETLGISAVSSSRPLLVSLTSSRYSSTCIEVNISCWTTFSDITMASSKLYPFHGIKTTFRFLPRANSPFFVPYPSVRIWPLTTLSPFFTIGTKFIQVFWLVFLYFGRW